MLKYAKKIGWDYVSAETAEEMRGGDAGFFFTEVLKAKLLELNKGIVDEARANEIIRQLKLLKPTIEGNRDALAWIQAQQSVFVPAEKRERNVRLIDFENPTQNDYHVTDEWWQRGTAYSNCADVVFLINGIPVAIAETKAAEKPNGLAEGVDQIRRYHRETPEMFISTQVFEVTQLLDFFYGASWSTKRKNIFNWKEQGVQNYETKIKTFFEPERFLQVLRDYIIFISKDDELSKVILRQHQTRAVEKVLERVGEKEKRRGLIWHTQGSGKTYTMLTIASKLLRAKQDEKPTVLMIVDRNELESQLFKNISGYGITTVKVAQSKNDLQDILASDYRGLVVTMIHKFDDIPANINKRDSVVVLVDEAHRTTGGDLGNYLIAALPNATYIGFTGTPIDKLATGKGTFKVFGVNDEKGYLDKYSIAESVDDGTTVKLNYALAPSNLMADRETLEKEFFALAETEGVSDIVELNAILDRAVELKEMLKSPQRVQNVAEHIAKHFKENIDPMGFKAFVVAVDREACALYKEALDKLLPTEWSKVVYSPAHNDREELKKFYLKEDEEKDIRKTFLKKDALPKILIVTEKLLTGFDAPILYCMYLDKPMRDHVLLQAIARVNRPYDDEEEMVKPYGLVYDFIGIFEKLKKALAFDSDIVASVIQNIDVLKGEFKNHIEEAKKIYLPLAKGFDDKAKEKAIDHFLEKTDREDFYKFFRRVQNLYDILSPDAFLYPYIKDFQNLSQLYALIRNAYNSIYVDKDLTRKTQILLRENTQGHDIEPPGAIHTLGKEELDKLKKSYSSDTSKILNLRKILNVLVDKDRTAKPFVLSIGERARALEEEYEDRQISTKQALLEFEKLAEEYVEADEERKKLKIDENTFAIYTVLKSSGEKIDVAHAKEINGIFERYPDYHWDQQQRSNLRAELYKVVRKVAGKDGMIAMTNELMKLRRV